MKCFRNKLRCHVEEAMYVCRFNMSLQATSLLLEVKVTQPYDTDCFDRRLWFQHHTCLRTVANPRIQID